MSKQICCATTVLEDAATAASEIDRVLTTMMYHSRPVYIGIPTDVAYEKISAGGLLVPLTTRLDPNSPALEEQILSEIVSRLRKAQKAAILIDGGSSAPSHCSVQPCTYARQALPATAYSKKSQTLSKTLAFQSLSRQWAKDP